MARGTPLSVLRDMVKAEIGFSQTVGSQLDLEINTLLSNEQKRLAAAWDWPFLQNRFDFSVGANARYVNVPNGNFERPPLVEIYWSAIWQEIDYGIGSEQFNYLNSDLGDGQDPIQRWEFAGQVNVPNPGPYGISVTQSAVAGNLSAGVYNYYFTFVTQFGETGPNPISQNAIASTVNKSIDLANIFTAPLPSVEGVNIPEVIARKIYRTKANGIIPYYLATIADNVTTVYHDGASDASLPPTVAPSSNNAEATIMEIWPLPQTSQIIRFTMQRILLPLISDTDTADLDDILLVKFVAAKLLIRRKQEDGQLLLNQAEQQLTRVRSNYPRKTERVVIGGGFKKDRIKVVPMTVIATHG